jgi:hypothetical protein
MENIALVRNLMLASLLVAPACVAEVDDDGQLDGNTDEELGVAEATLSSRDCPAGTPAALAPPSDQNLAFMLDATGVQKYSCNATATGAAWTFVAPEADLFSDCRQVGTHYAGPTWEYRDGSTVVAAKAAGATVDTTAIPWLLLTAVSHGGPVGKMTSVTSIQRLATEGGNAPTTGCDAGHIGATVNVPYTAKYFFYRPVIGSPLRNTRCGATL